MSQRRVRARDVDRDAAIEIVEAAWSDGQLIREEYDQRVRRLLRASTLDELEQEIVDLQPEGTEWRPSSGVPADIAELVSSAPVRRNSTTTVVALVLTAIVVIGGVMYVNIGSDSPPPSDKREQVVAAESPFTPASFIAAREALVDQSGSDSVYSAVLTSDKFEVVRPVSATGNEAVKLTWDGRWSAGRPTTSSAERLSLGLVSAEAVSTILADARQQSDDEVDVTLLFAIERHEGRRVCITATVAGGAEFSRRYDCRGQLVGS
ncbi:DUF1707 domain-containing protein [Aeromicrobium sp. P5_D10]